MKEPYHLVRSQQKRGAGVPIHGLWFSRLDFAPRLCQTPDMNATVSPLLDITLGRSGVLAGGNLIASAGRALTAADLGLVATTKVNAPQVLKRIRASHHQAARLLAQGSKPGEVSALSGFSSSRISVLQNDPAFQELIVHYTTVEQSRFADVQERMTMLGLAAGEEILDRLHDEPEQISSRELTDILKATLDRGGHAPVTRSENKNLSVVLGAEDLEALKDAGTQSTILSKASLHDEEKPILEMEKTLPEDQPVTVGEDNANRPLRLKLKAPAGLSGAGDSI